MAVVIHNFEMPEHCFNCSRKINPDERQCNIDRHVFEETLGVITNHRDKDCPLQEIQQLEDCISRQAVLNMSTLIELDDGQHFDSIDPEDVKKLLPVMPVAAIANIKFDKEDLEKIVNERLEGIERKKG